MNTITSTSEDITATVAEDATRGMYEDIKTDAIENTMRELNHTRIMQCIAVVKLIAAGEKVVRLQSQLTIAKIEEDHVQNSTIGTRKKLRAAKRTIAKVQERLTAAQAEFAQLENESKVVQQEINFLELTLHTVKYNPI